MNLDDYDDRAFNIFGGFKARFENEKHDSDGEIIDAFRTHILDVWAAADDTRFSYLLNWFASLIHAPRCKIGQTALVLYSKSQQIGKNIITDFLRDWVFGKNLACETEGLKSVTSKFNGLFANKLLTVVNEAPQNRDTFHEMWEQMKNKIVSKVTQMELKGIDSFQIDDYNRYIITTNNTFSIKVEESDVRYAVFECTDKYRGQKEYFSNLARILNNRHAGNVIFKYLYDMYDPKFNMQDVPFSELKEQMKLSSRPKTSMFIEEFISNEYRFSDDVVAQYVDRAAGTASVPSDLLYREYCAWTTNGGFGHPLNKVIFGREIGEKVGASKPVKKFGKLARCFVFEVEVGNVEGGFF
jgi:hypothetical protein